MQARNRLAYSVSFDAAAVSGYAEELKLFW